MVPLTDVQTSDDGPAAVIPRAVAGRPARTARRVAALCGPAFVVSVAYVDPGNFATNMAGGPATATGCCG